MHDSVALLLDPALPVGDTRLVSVLSMYSDIYKLPAVSGMYSVCAKIHLYLYVKISLT